MARTSNAPGHRKRPLREQVTARAASRPAGFEPTRSRRSEKSRPILVVDDDSSQQEALREIFEAAGYSVASASSGREAIALMESGVEPSLILLDWIMPDMDGEQFSREVLDHPSWLRVPIVVVSGAPRTELVRKASVISHFVPKPAPASTLLQIVASYVPPGSSRY